jgi:hypothetical protein
MSCQSALVIWDMARVSGLGDLPLWHVAVDSFLISAACFTVWEWNNFNML